MNRKRVRNFFCTIFDQRPIIVCDVDNEIRVRGRDADKGGSRGCIVSGLPFQMSESDALKTFIFSGYSAAGEISSGPLQIPGIVRCPRADENLVITLEREGVGPYASYPRRD